MNESVISDSIDSGPAVGTGAASPVMGEGRSKRLCLARASPPQECARDSTRGISHVSISVDEEGRLEFESRFDPKHVEQMTDVLLLMLIRAREKSR